LPEEGPTPPSMFDVRPLGRLRRISMCVHRTPLKMFGVPHCSGLERRACPRRLTTSVRTRFRFGGPRKQKQEIHMSNKAKKLEARNALNRHARKCVVCHHPDRDAIEEEFIHWRSPYEIARQFRIADYRSLYRHARSTGILDLRRHNFYSALDSLVEAAEEAKVTGDCVIRAIRAYSCLDSRGHWVDPPTQVNFSTNSIPAARPTQRAAAPNTKLTRVIDIAEPDPVHQLQSEQESDTDPDSESNTDSQFVADSESDSESSSDPNSNSTPDPAFIAELEALLASPVTDNPATRDLNLIYRRAIRTGLNYLKT
jgi:hypothetical protein